MIPGGSDDVTQYDVFYALDWPLEPFVCRESTVSTGRVSVPIRIKPVDKTTRKKSADLGNIQRDLKVFIVTDVYSGSRPSKMYSLVFATCQAKVGSNWEKNVAGNFKVLLEPVQYF